MTNRELPDGGRELATPGAHLARFSRVQLGGRALPRRGTSSPFDSNHAHASAAVPRMGRSATNAVGEGSSPSGGTTSDGLRSGTSLVSKTGRAGFDPPAACDKAS